MTQQDLPMSSICELCGEPMPDGERMFKYHGYSGPCPKPPLKKQTPSMPTMSELISIFRKARIASTPSSDIGADSAGLRAVLDALKPVVAEAVHKGIVMRDAAVGPTYRTENPTMVADRIIAQLKGESRE